MSIISHTLCPDQPDYIDAYGTPILLMPSTLTEAEIFDLGYYDALANTLTSLDSNPPVHLFLDFFTSEATG